MRRRQFTVALLACVAGLAAGCKDIAAPFMRAHPLIGVYVFGGWAAERTEFDAVPHVQCTARFPWRELKTDDRHMERGEYDERDPEIARYRVALMEQAGIGFAAYQIELAHEHTQPSKRPSWRPVLSDPLIMKHCADNHPLDSKVRFCIDWWDVSAGDAIWQEMKKNGWTAGDVLNSHRWFAREVATRYMTRSNYLTIKGRPVMVRGAAHNLQFYQEQFGIAPAEIVRAWREEVKAVTGSDLYLVATATEPVQRSKLKGWGFDCLTEYVLHGDGWQDTEETYRWWWSQPKHGLDYWTPATCGYDSAAWNYPVKLKHHPTPKQFIAHLIEAFKISAVTIIYAWNEIGEGGILEPMARGQLHDGDEMLRAVKEVTRAGLEPAT